MDLRMIVNTIVDLIQVLKEIFGKIKAVDPTAMLVLVCDQGQEINYINKAVYILNRKESIRDYLFHSITRNNWLGHFTLRLH